MSNIFAKAKQPKKKKKEEKITITIKGDVFSEKLAQFATLKTKMDEIKSDLAMSQEFVKEAGIEEYIKLVEDKKTNTGSFILISDTGGQVMVSPTKRYIKIDEAAAETLQEQYGDSIVSEDTKYGFNTKVLIKNMDIISELIQNSTDISDDDKENLIEQTTAYSIKKDTLDKVYLLSNEAEVDVSDVIDDIQPVFTLKNATAGSEK